MEQLRAVDVKSGFARTREKRHCGMTCVIAAAHTREDDRSRSCCRFGEPCESVHLIRQPFGGAARGLGLAVDLA